jgi:glycosyltransferase involved in cell wall biosynthesis
MNNLKTISVGISAYNEEENIGSLLNSILEQRGSNFKLDKIIIACDGSSDTTPQIIKKYSKKNKFIELIEDGERLGKAQRLNQIYKLNKSDYLITLDADVLFESTSEIEKLIKHMENTNKIKVLAANLIPIQQPGFIGKVIYKSNNLWNELRKNINNGDHITNLYGAATMLESKFAKSVQYPKNLTCDQGYLYLSAKRVNGFAFASDARVLFLPPNNLDGFKTQGDRFINERQQLVTYFGEKALAEYSIPFNIKAYTTIKTFAKDPLYTTLVVLLNISVNLSVKKDQLNDQGIWKRVESTKNIYGQSAGA